MTSAAYFLWTDESLSSNQLIFDVVEDERWRGGAEVTKYPVERGSNVTDNVRPETDAVTLRVFATNEPIGSNNWATPLNMPLEVDIPSPSWIPGSGIVPYTRWRNNIELRALAASGLGLLGGLAGSTGSAVGAIGGGILLGALIPGIVVPELQSTNTRGIPPQTLPAFPQTQQFLSADDFVKKILDLLDTLKNAAQLITVAGSKKSVDNMVIVSIEHRRASDTGTGAEITIGLEEIRFVDTTNAPAPIPTLPRAQATVSQGAQSTTDASDKQSDLFSLVN